MAAVSLIFNHFFNETLSITFFFFRPFEPCAQIWPNTTAKHTFYYCTARVLHQFSNFLVYQGRELIFCVWDWINITLLYTFFWLTRCSQCTFCTAQSALCTVFLTFLSLKLESCNFVCSREFWFRKHSYTVFFDNLGSHSAHFALQSARFAPFSQLFCL